MIFITPSGQSRWDHLCCVVDIWVKQVYIKGLSGPYAVSVIRGLLYIRINHRQLLSITVILMYHMR